MEFYIGQVFDGEYPPEAAEWCNGNNALIEETTKEGAEQRTFVIAEIPPEPPTETVRIFSKYKLCDTTSQIPFTLADGTQTTVWEAFKNFLSSAGKKDLWDNIVEVAEDNPHFVQAIPFAVEVFGQDLVNRILDASVERITRR